MRCDSQEVFCILIEERRFQNPLRVEFGKGCFKTLYLHSVHYQAINN